MCGGSHGHANGIYIYPAPLDQMPDGIHPSPKGFRTIFDNVLTQGLASWLDTVTAGPGGRDPPAHK